MRDDDTLLIYFTGHGFQESVFSMGFYDGGGFRCKPGFGESVILATVGKTALDIRGALIAGG